LYLLFCCITDTGSHYKRRVQTKLCTSCVRLSYPSWICDRWKW